MVNPREPVLPRAAMLAIEVVPPLKLNAPVIAFEVLESVSVPLPSFVKPPVPRLTVPLKVVLPEPPTLRLRFVPVTLPDTVSRPASELIRLLVPRAMFAPVQMLLPLMFRKAPSLASPEPLSVRASPVTVIPPCSCSAAELLTVVAPPVVPRALLF